jgi:hypothetical protein
MLELGVKFLISYFIGSLMGAMIVGKLRGGVDIRTMGSGNAGGTNALRTQGVLFALTVVVIDVGKGIIGAGVVPGLELPLVAPDPEISRTWLTMCCAAAAVVGHACGSRPDADNRGAAGLGSCIGSDRVCRACLDDRRNVTAGLAWRHPTSAGPAIVHVQRRNGSLHHLLPRLQHPAHA